MTVLEKIKRCGIVPVVVIEDAKDAVATAHALLNGGIDIMEITFRTAAASDAIRLVAEHCPEMTVGAGTVITLEQYRTAAEAGAQFIVSPGYSEDLVAQCVADGMTVMPGCVTPTEIMTALRHGLRVLKFFPANVYGGLSGMKSLSAPFTGVQFVPTGGVNSGNIAEYASAPFVYAVGGSWVCPKADISSGNFAHIEALCREAKNNMRSEAHI